MKQHIKYGLDAPKITLKKWPSTPSISEFSGKTYMTMDTGVTWLESQPNRSIIFKGYKCDIGGFQYNYLFRRT